MRLTKIAVIALVAVLLLSAVACGTKSYQLYTSVSGQGNITPSNGTLPEGDAITLIAMPESGWQFDHWEGDLNGNQSPVTITMDKNKTIVAYFTEVETTLPPTPPPGFVTYTDKTIGFSIFYPNSWQVEGDKVYNSVGFIAPSRCLGENIISSVYNFGTEYPSLETYYSEIALNRSYWDNYHLISKENLIIDGVPAIKVICTFGEYTNSGYTIIKEMDVFLIREQTLWSIGGGCATTCWDTYEGTFNTMLNSFQILD